MNELTELTPKYDNAKSFYRKAFIKENRKENELYNDLELYSCGALVCTIKHFKFYNATDFFLNGCINKTLLFSNTTLRHIKEFLKQYYYHCDVDLTKKDLLNHVK